MDLAKLHSEGTGRGDDAQPGVLNDVVVLSYSPVGSLSAYAGSAQVEAREALVPGHQIATHSIRVELSSGGDYPRTAFATIESKDVENLIRVLEKMESVSIRTDRFKFTEVQYELGGLKIIVFNNDKGHLLWALSADSVQLHFNGLKKIGELRGLIEKAKAHLERLHT